MKEIGIQPAKPSDHEAITDLLRSENLPTDDLQDGFTEFFTANNGDSIVGVIGLEKYDEYALLRSLALKENSATCA
jgi:amino-acid N-acetyltransferase